MEILEKYRDSIFIGVLELAEAADEVLKKTDILPNGKASSRLPNERSIRYYLTEGLLPPADATKGTSSIFSFRHLVTLVLIKRLQAFGLSNRIIQRIIAGRGDEELEKLLTEPIDISADPRAALKAALRGETVVEFTDKDEISELSKLKSLNEAAKGPDNLRHRAVNYARSEDLINQKSIESFKNLDKSKWRRDDEPDRLERYRIAEGVEISFSKDCGLSKVDQTRVVEELRNKIKKILGSL